MDDFFIPPFRHHLIKLGPFSYYWIWASGGRTKIWIASWHTQRNYIHLAHWRWWTPLAQFVPALRAACRISAADCGDK